MFFFSLLTLLPVKGDSWSKLVSRAAKGQDYFKSKEITFSLIEPLSQPIRYYCANLPQDDAIGYYDFMDNYGTPKLYNLFDGSFLQAVQEEQDVVILRLRDLLPAEDETFIP